MHRARKPAITTGLGVSDQRLTDLFDMIKERDIKSYIERLQIISLEGANRNKNISAHMHLRVPLKDLQIRYNVYKWAPGSC